jgi:geranyl-CoA carboxylase alpha subunit
VTQYRPFKSVLIANRGEIAKRIVEVVRDASMQAIAVYSDPDWKSPHVWAADKAVHIGPAEPARSYLSPSAIIAAAKNANAEAIHPGYGFLSENATFAQAVIDAGFVWIGPPPSAIQAMANKANAKRLAWKAGLPLIPGYDGEDQNDEKLRAEANRVGYPIMIKAADGGGGRGMRRVDEPADFIDALHAARREALNAFGSDTVILERALDRVRHIEIQILADTHGNFLHLGERDCSVQRRNQKIIEEAPSPFMTPALRERMSDAALRLARAVNYVNAGTVEFLVDSDRNFYFLEMNTRLQVEHPVTERIVHYDLINLQLDIAAGAPLPFTQNEIEFDGHAIELRLCAEDPDDGFRPQSGEVISFYDPGGGRIDAGIEHGTAVPPTYDSLLAKVIAHAPTREEARLKGIELLRNTVVLGVKTNKAYLAEILADPEFSTGSADTSLLGRRPRTVEKPLDSKCAAIAALFLAHGQGNAWRSTGMLRSTILLRHGSEKKTFTVVSDSLDGIRLFTAEFLDDRKYFQAIVRRDGAEARAAVATFDGKIHVDFDGRDAIFEDVTYAPAEPKGASGANIVRAPMAGRIVKVMAEPGAEVAKNQVLVILEAMKMEHELRALANGVVETVAAKPGDQVAIRQTLVTLASG